MNNSRTLMSHLENLTGLSKKEINSSIIEKEKVLKWLVRQNIDTVDAVGEAMAHYYTDKDALMHAVNKNKGLG
jgi:hypothetical protein